MNIRKTTILNSSWANKMISYKILSRVSLIKKTGLDC